MASKYLYVAAIDFGTTYSGWAYLSRDDFATNQTRGYVRPWYSGSGTLTTEKTPTVVLIKPDGRTLEAFGYEAENRYRELVEEEDAGSFYYFRRFKMMLMQKFGENITSQAELEDEMGRRLSALSVFALAIEYLVHDAHLSLANKCSGILLKDIKWVLTVPAIWTDPAKQFMRQAAEKAGISSDKLVIPLEPECASILCRDLPLERRLDETCVNASSFPVGTKYIVLDLGGGTVDITVHEIDQSGALKEIIAASGGGWGGILVDQAFEEMLVNIVGKKVYQQFKTKSTEDWLELWRDFEQKKRNFNGRLVTIRVSGMLSEYYRNEHERELSEDIQSSIYGSSIKLKVDKMKFQSSLWEQLYDQAINKTICHVKELIAKKEFEGINTLIMVGGFSESTLLQERIKNSFRMNVLIPTEASSAVLRGALVFGFNPGCIIERVLQYTFGFACTLPFIEGIHPESKREVGETKIKCINCFNKHVEIGEVVKYGESQTPFSYSPPYRNAKSLFFSLYYSKQKNPRYTDEKGCYFLESFEVPLTDPPGDLDRVVYVSLTFSGTEIEAECREENTGKITKAKCRLPCGS